MNNDNIMNPWKGQETRVKDFAADISKAFTGIGKQYGFRVRFDGFRAGATDLTFEIKVIPADPINEKLRQIGKVFPKVHLKKEFIHDGDVYRLEQFGTIPGGPAVGACTNLSTGQVQTLPADAIVSALGALS